MDQIEQDDATLYPKIVEPMHRAEVRDEQMQALSQVYSVKDNASAKGELETVPEIKHGE